MTGFFIVPALASLNGRYPKLRAGLRAPVNLLNFRENLCDVMVGFGPLADDGLESRAVGFLHLVGCGPLLCGGARHAGLGRPGSHRFIDANYYASETPTFAPWRGAVARRAIAHHCENPFAYGLMVKAGLGIGLLGNFVMSDPDFLPVGLGIYVRLPIYIHALSERLKSRPVRIVFDWLADVFSADKPMFGPELSLDLAREGTVSPSIRHLAMGLPQDHPE